MNNVILDILILTHNHENFIADCLNSVLSQECSYPYRIVVLDDASDDNTFKVISEISGKSGKDILVLSNQTNLGIIPSAHKLSKYAKSKYVCFLDGDDYWSYNGKLQSQIEFLEKNHEYVGCFHDAEIKHVEYGNSDEYFNRTQHDWKTYSQFNRYSHDFMPWELVNRNIIPTATLIFRNIDLTAFLSQYKYAEYSLSWALHLQIIAGSKFYYFNQVWSVYNDHPAGISKRQNLIKFKRNNILILEGLLLQKNYLYFRYEIYKSICSEFRMIIKSSENKSLDNKEFKKLLKQYKKYLKLVNKSDIKQLKEDFINVRNNRMVE
jgi:glycosyltransferase involved in cell wall biosynthesis